MLHITESIVTSISFYDHDQRPNSRLKFVGIAKSLEDLNVNVLLKRGH